MNLKWRQRWCFCRCSIFIFISHHRSVCVCVYSSLCSVLNRPNRWEMIACDSTTHRSWVQNAAAGDQIRKRTQKTKTTKETLKFKSKEKIKMIRIRIKINDINTLPHWFHPRSHFSDWINTQRRKKKNSKWSRNKLYLMRQWLPGGPFSTITYYYISLRMVAYFSIFISAIVAHPNHHCRRHHGCYSWLHAKYDFWPTIWPEEPAKMSNVEKRALTIHLDFSLLNYCKLCEINSPRVMFKFGNLDAV